MAVEDKYVNTELIAGKLANSALTRGADTITLVTTFEVAAADDDGSVFRIAQGLSPNLIPVDIKVLNDALTAGDDFDLGLYEQGVGGTVVDKDVFADGLDLSSAHIFGASLDGLVTVDVANATKQLFEHAGHTLATKKEGYDLALTANTVGTLAGTVTVIATFIQG